MLIKNLKKGSVPTLVPLIGFIVGIIGLIIGIILYFI